MGERGWIPVACCTDEACRSCEGAGEYWWDGERVRATQMRFSVCNPAGCCCDGVPDNGRSHDAAEG